MQICTIMQLGEATTCTHQKPKRNMGKRTFKYAGAIYVNSLPNHVKSATSVNSFKKMLTDYFTLQF